ncbi:MULTISPECIES: hypothetical protein [Alkalicoccobacillus]|uniref:DUF1049 domain-containing protein n=2 Tax=Alkalicoccobacillus TaxID=2893059 RepID=A0ABT0XG80_9BACI|nr:MULTISPECIES: hypothetical protein [Alkalicoccobacillus]MCM2674906.1 hypothetical protein [Alkalicoccobacillus plakortidis]MDQ0208842.1 low temperature requirement protein LtrA [Alkalicoccobacillus murimartini]
MKANRLLFLIIVMMFFITLNNVSTSSFSFFSDDLTFLMISLLFVIALVIQAMTLPKMKPKKK